jgi:hypothetical protein
MLRDALLEWINHDGHQHQNLLLLISQERRYSGHCVTSRLCQFQTWQVQQKGTLLDDFVGAQ